MLNFLSFFVLFALAAAAPLPEVPPVRYLNSLPVDNPSFAFLDRTLQGANSNYSLILTSFKPFAKDHVRVVRDITTPFATGFKSIEVADITDTITWPNEARLAPVSMEVELGLKMNQNLLVVAGGFLVPLKGHGAVTLLPFEFNSDGSVTSKPFPITTTTNLFYHRTLFVDANGDGLTDILTARTRKPIIGTSPGQLVLLLQPSENALSQPWEERVLIEGPDVFFKLADVDADGEDELVVGQFFNPRLSIWDNLNWNDTSVWKEVVIDDGSVIGPIFDVNVLSLTGDQQLHILVTNHVNKQEQSGVYAYEIPSDIHNGKFILHTLASGFKTLKGGPGQASPGTAIPCWPTSASKVPSLVLSGDGNESVYLLTPDPSTPLSYNVTVMKDLGGTVGDPACADVNGDGYSDIIVPSYDENMIVAFTFAP